jgi:hypothetical protein
MKKLLVVLFWTLLIDSSHGDSPLTSTEFHVAYLDIPIVQQTMQSKGKLTNEILKFLVSDTNPLDVKLAIINASGWSNCGTKKSEAYLKYVVKTKNYKAIANSASLAFKWNATSDELICFAYILALENYFDVSYANGIAEAALMKNPNSLAVNLICRLIKAQGLFSLNENCYAYKQFNSAENNSLLKSDFRTEGVKIMSEYMQSLGANCK